MNSKTMIIALTLHITAALIAIGAHASLEQTPFEMSCRNKAKEVAAETYRGCVTENRKAQVEQLRAEYQEKLKSLKEEYEIEIKKAAGVTSSKALPETSRVAPLKAPKLTARNSLAPRKKSNSSVSVTLKGNSDDEMNVQLRKSPAVMTDDSSMDIPEPIPVENLSGSDS